MSNYNQLNIYKRQMLKLGLTTKEYANLLDMPYEVVKDVIYDKEGDYKMVIKDFLGFQFGWCPANRRHLCPPPR